MKKHLIATCILAMLFSLLPVQALADKEGAKQRAVTLVYDDSGSMRNGKNRWKYASYALQSFVGLLDEQDLFSYVPMSQPSREITVDLSTKKRQQEIEGIRGWKEYDNTPFTAVETAIQALKQQAEVNTDRELWLIVLTDGAFNELESPNSAQYEANQQHIREALQSFQAWMENKKVSLHSVLITMDQDLSVQEKAQMDAFQQLWEESLNGTVLEADQETGIIDSVDTAAALIANRDPFSNAEDYVQVKIEGDIATVSTPFPLRRLTVVQQTNSGGEMVELERIQNTSLQMEGPFQTATPEGNMITGSIVHIVPKGEAVMDPGSYKLQFTGALAADQLKVLAEPSLDYTVKIYQKEGNQLVEATEAPYSNSTVVVEAKPTDLPVDASYFSASIEYGGKSIAMKWNEKRKAFQSELTLGSSAIRGNVHMNIKGFYRQSKEFRIQPVAKPKLSIKVLTSNWTEKVNRLENSKPIIIQPLLDGRIMSKQQVKELLKTATASSNKTISFEWKQHGNQLYLYPRPYLSDTLNFTDTGEIKATILLRDAAAERVQKQIIFHVEDVTFFERYTRIFAWILPISAAILILSILLTGWIVRPRFHKRGLIYYELDQSISEDWIHEAEPQLLQNRWWRHYLGIPYRAERRTVQSIVFIAKQGSKAIWIAKESQVEGMMIEGAFLTEDEIGKEHRTLYPNETVVIDRGYGKEIYRYECD